MKKNIKMEDEVYFIGQEQSQAQRIPNKRLIKRVLLPAICVIVAALIYICYPTQQRNDSNAQLQEVEVVSKEAIAPIFNGDQDINGFMVWIAKHLEYPEGHETEDAMVVVSFIVSKTGEIKDIQIVSESEEKAFGKQVVALLESCPKWIPGKLADGTPTDVSYTLPVRFTKIRK